jgi:hypothetical protein
MPRLSKAPKTSDEKCSPFGGGTKKLRVFIIAVVILFALAAPGFQYKRHDKLLQVASVKASREIEPVGSPEDDSSRELKIWIEASHSFVCPADGSARLSLKVRGVSEGCQPRYSWKVNGGVIEGVGAEIVWNLFGVQPQPGKYYDAIVTVKTGPACGSRKATAIWRACVVCPLGVGPPTPLRRMPPTPPPRKPLRLCPNISFGTRATATTGQNVSIIATLNGGTPVTAPKFQWTVWGGSINGGQGTGSIVVGAGGAGQTILAKVEVGGYGSGTPCSATCRIPVVPAPTPTPPVLTSVKLTPATATVGLGNHRFTAQAFDQFARPMAGVAITFKSSNTQAATVDGVKRDVINGSATAIITGHASGTTQIIATGLASINTVTSAPALLTVTTTTPPPPPPPITLRVSVIDNRDGRPIQVAHVVLDDDRNTVFPTNLTTDQSGNFERTGLRPGEYRIKVSAPGFVEQERHITLTGSQSVPEIFSLSYVPAPPTPTPPPPEETPCKCCTFNPQSCSLVALCGLAALAVGAYFTLSGLNGALATAQAVGDEVHCTVFAPFEARDCFLVQAFAHLPEQAMLLAGKAAESEEDAKQRGTEKLKRRIERGKELSFTLQMQGLEIDEPTQSFTWEGEIDSAKFSVTIPKDCKPGRIIGKVTIAYESIPVGHVRFTVKVMSDAQQPATVAAASIPIQSTPLPPSTLPSTTLSAPPQSFVRYRKAFISYASEDRPEVLKRVQMLSSAKINFFQDVLTLEPGERWAKSLYRHIDESDVVFLFWSNAAKRSTWVEKEVQYALERKGDNEDAPPEIVPIPIEGPPVITPPAYLQQFHFNDKFVYFIRGEQIGWLKRLFNRLFKRHQ